jgi:hypothetical protein
MAEARRRIGLAPSQRGILIVAGSWGVGDVVEAFDLIAASAEFVPVVVCGRNDALAAELRRRGGGLVFGWTDQMPLLMRACDAVVQNAGGLTCMEAFASGVPVLSFRPIPGHGIENAEDMETAGVAGYVRDAQDLLPALAAATGPARPSMRRAASEMFAGDAAAEAVALARHPVVVPLAPRRSRVRVAVAGAAAFYLTFTVGVGVAAAHGVGVTRPPRRSDNVFLAVRLSDAAARDPNVDAALAQLHASAVIDGDLARTDPNAIAGLQAAGVDVVNGGTGHRVRIRAERAEEDVSATGRMIGREMGRHCTVFVPDRRLTGYDLVVAHMSHEKVVIGPTISAGSAPVSELRAGRVYVVDGRDVSPAQLTASLHSIGAVAVQSGLTPAALAAI